MELTEKYQSRQKDYDKFLNRVKKQAVAFSIDYRAVVAELNEGGIAGLNNGLFEDEIRELFETPHVPMMVSLLLKGRAKCKLDS